MRYLVATALSVCFVALTAYTPTLNGKRGKTKAYGAAMTKDGAIAVAQLPEKMSGVSSLAVKIRGQIASACQVKGCWMTTDLGNGKSMRIRFKDYGFFVPKDCSGKQFYAQGVASWDTTSVAELKHFAYDAGKPKEEIEKITEPEVGLTFTASGVLIE